MKPLIITFALLIAAGSAYSQTAKACSFKSTDTKSRNDQYASSSKDDIKKSKKEMAGQMDEFDKKKYQGIVKGKYPGMKKKVAPRYM